MTECQTRGKRNARKGLSRNTILASALDPRTKKLAYLSDMNKDLVRLEVKKEINKIESVSSTAANIQTASVSISSSTTSLGFQVFDCFDDEVEDINLNENNSERAKMDTNIQFEFTDYFSHNPNLKRIDKSNDTITFGSPLEWWKMNNKRFPNLAKLARKFLCIPASSASSERVFSAAGQVIAKKRARLDPTLVADMVLLHNSWDEIVEIRKKMRSNQC